jgi:hypothetical protein
MTNKYCFGISSRCFDGKHILLGDIDSKDISLTDMKMSLKAIQERFNLPDIHIVSSTHGYNFFCLARLHLNLVKDILLEVTDIDKTYTDLGYKRGYYVLRMDFDKDYVTTVRDTKGSRRKQSFAHKIFFENMLEITLDMPHWLHDNSLHFRIVEYQSEKNGYYTKRS